MTVEFDKSFERWLSKINNKAVLKRIEGAIIQMEGAESIDQIKHIKKLSGFRKYYRVKLGNHRIGIERIN